MQTDFFADRKVQLAQTDFGPMLIYAADRYIGQFLVRDGSWAEKTVHEVVTFLADRQGFMPGTFIDIGANIGTHLIYALKKSGFTSGVGIEPEGNNFDLLSCNVILNGLAARTRLVNVAVSNRMGVADFTLSSENLGDHRLYAGASSVEENRSKIQVPIHTPDDIFRDSEIDWSRTLIWIDTQGQEGHILNGFEKVFNADAKPAVVIEFAPTLLSPAGGVEFYFDFLKRCKSIYNLGTHQWWTSGALDIETVRQMFSNCSDKANVSYGGHTDLLCLL